MAEHSIVGAVTRPKPIIGYADKGTGMGELPSASGLSQFPMPAYSAPGAALASVQAVIAKKAGVEAPVFPEGWMDAVEGIEEPQEVLFGPGGKMYMEHMTIKTTTGVNTWDTYNMYSQCSELKSVVSEGDAIAGYARMFHTCRKLESAILATFTSLSSETFQNCTSLKVAQIGSIGMPVTSIASSFGSTNAELVITIYVADDATLPLANSPFGNSNATIIYRSATTGEVIEV